MAGPPNQPAEFFTEMPQGQQGADFFSEVPRGPMANDPNLDYGQVLPVYRDKITGHTGFAWPEIIRSIVRGVNTNPMTFDMGDPQQMRDVSSAANVLAPGIAGAAKGFAGSMAEAITPRARVEPRGPTAPTDFIGNRPMPATGRMIDVPGTALPRQEGEFIGNQPMPVTGTVIDATPKELPAPAKALPAPTNVLAPTPKAQAIPPTRTQAGFTLFKPGQLSLDPDRFQYKTSDAKGVTGELAGAKRWEPNLANPILVYEDLDGKNYIVNGHQRLDLATRAETAGQDVEMPARVLRAADGYTPQYMKALGAYQNIAEGSGLPMDAAKVMRTAGDIPEDMRLPDLPPNKQLVKAAKGLVALDDAGFQMVEAGAVPPEYAAIVGDTIKDPAQQVAALKVLQRAEPSNAAEAQIMVRDIQQSGFADAVANNQFDMFGATGPAMPLFVERARVLSNAIRRIRGEKASFGAAIKGEKTLEGAGNVLSRATNIARKTDNERLLQLLENDATKRGPISDALNTAASDIARGGNLSKAIDNFVRKIRSLDGGGSEKGGAGGADNSGEGNAQPTENVMAGLF